jgi:hypothetical protein
MDIEEAKARVVRAINRGYATQDDELVLLDDETITKDYGWVFFYQSRRFLVTGSLSDRLAGNGPVIVLRKDGSIHQLGGNEPIETMLESFERSLLSS